MKKFVRSLSFLMVLLLAVSFLPCLAGAAEKTPAELDAVKVKAKDIASNCAQKLKGAWGDQHVALVNSKKGKDFEGYKNMRDTLSGFVAEAGAPQIYALYPTGAIDKAPYIITVDGSKTDDCGKENEWEPGFAAAWKGAVEAGEEAWKNDDGALMMSGYAAIRDSKGDVVAILGVDILVP